MQREFLDKISVHIESILGIMEDGIYISAPDGMTLFVNKTYEELTGLKYDQIRGKNVQDLVSEGVFNTILNPAIVKTSRPATSIQRLANNKKVILRGFPIFDDQGAVCLVVTFVRDITVTAQLNEQVARQRKLIDDYHERIAFITKEQGTPYLSVNIFESQAMQGVVGLLGRVAPTDATVLLLGETGVGKDVLARLTHDLSSRKDKMFLKVDCGSISESLIESELFGYTPGAFSGASSKGKLGYFEIADGGTVMLDEIGSLPLPMQAKLLRVLQDHEVMRVGSSSPRKVDVRIIAATNKDLEDSMKNGQFRSDLYYRLNVAVLKIPPLRERQKDIRALIHHFLQRFTGKYKHHMTFSESTLKVLEGYHWPGNVRELQNLVHGLVITRDQPVILPSDLPPHILGHSKVERQHSVSCPFDSRPLREIMADLERELISDALESLGSVSKVAELFQINRSTIFRKLKKSTLEEAADN